MYMRREHNFFIKFWSSRMEDGVWYDRSWSYPHSYQLQATRRRSPEEKTGCGNLCLCHGRPRRSDPSGMKDGAWYERPSLYPSSYQFQPRSPSLPKWKMVCGTSTRARTEGRGWALRDQNKIRCPVRPQPAVPVLVPGQEDPHLIYFRRLRSMGYFLTDHLLSNFH
jgi:hypothetical protein